ncbi:MAG: M16 family metallopeptidase [Planctomycetaceae bacterium]
MNQSLHSTTLANGIAIVGERMPELESVAVAFHAAAGSIHDPPERCGLATVTGEMCLRGAGDRDSRQLVEDLESAGVQWSQGVSSTHLSVSGAMVARQLAAVLPIYADILRRPLVPADELPAARQMVLQNLAGIEDEPAHRTIAALRRLQCPAPWGLPTEGVSQEVEAIGIDDVRTFAARHLQPAGMIVSVAGRIDWDDFVARIEGLLGDWQAAPPPPVATGPRGAAVGHVAHDAQQTHIAIGCSVPPYRDDASHESTAALAILGGGPSSRFFTEVRERRALCYSVSAGYQTNRDFAHAVCYAGTTAERAQETLDVMLAEIARLPGTITREEVDRVKARAKSILIMQQESSAARAGAIARQWYHLGGLRTLAEELDRYDRLDHAAIEGWLAANPPTDVTVVSLGREPLELPDGLPA